MGEAKRRRLAAGPPTVLVPHADGSGMCEVPVKWSGSLGKFMKSRMHWDNELRAGRNNFTVDVPCGSCRECCWHQKVEVDAAVDDVARLDTVIDEDGCTVLRKREDGACVHLGENGCSVYRHRPRACRQFDCRIFSLYGACYAFDGEHRAPLWRFTLNTQEERVLGNAINIAMLTHRDVTSPERVVEKRSAEMAKFLPLARVLTSLVDDAPEGEKEAVAVKFLESVMLGR